MPIVDFQKRGKVFAIWAMSGFGDRRPMTVLGDQFPELRRI
jgi:hypothetical protein